MRGRATRLGCRRSSTRRVRSGGPRGGARRTSRRRTAGSGRGSWTRSCVGTAATRGWRSTSTAKGTRSPRCAPTPMRSRAGGSTSSSSRSRAGCRSTPSSSRTSTSGRTSWGADPGHFAFVREALAAGLEVLDLLPEFSRRRDEGLFLRFDHHWAPGGAELAAELVAARVAACLGVDLEPQPREEPATMSFLPDVPDTMTATPEPQEVPIRRVAAPVPADRASPVLVIGDSHVDFLDEERAGFATQLAAELGTAVDAIALPAGGTDQVWRAVRRRGDGLAGKRVVVWIFSTGRLPLGSWPFLDPVFALTCDASVPAPHGLHLPGLPLLLPADRPGGVLRAAAWGAEPVPVAGELRVLRLVEPLVRVA